ncbi:MAG: transporter substrate-binding domain-containing protein [Desulfurivibrionaceae bacterium]
MSAKPSGTDSWSEHRADAQPRPGKRSRRGSVRQWYPLLIFWLLLAVSPATAAQDGAKLLFLGNKNIAPVVYLENGRPVGVAVDLVLALAPHLPRPVEIQAMDWQEAQALVAKGEADALIQINATAERKKTFAFSDPLLESQFSIFTAANRVGISGLSSLGGLTVGVEAGGLPQLVLGNNPRVRLTIIPNFLAGFRQIESGAIDAVVVDYRVGSYVLAENKIRGIKATGEPIAVSTSAFAVRKGNTELLTAINEALRIIKADGTYQKVLDKWHPSEGIFKTRRQISHQMFASITLFLTVLLLIAVLWLVTLKRELAAKKAARLKLQEQYATLAGIIDSVDAPIFSVDSRYLYTSFNRQYARTMQTLYGVEIALGQSLLAYMTVAEDRETARRHLDRALAGEQFTEEAYSGEEARSRHYFQVSHNPIRAEGGAIIGVAVLVQDMTSRKRSEERVAVGEARFRALFEDSPISLWEEDFAEVKRRVEALRAAGITDFGAYFTAHPEEVALCAETVRISAVNQATLTLFKADDQEHLLTGLADIFCDESLAIFREELITLATGGMRFHSEAVQKTLIGEAIDTAVHLTVAPGYEESWEKVLVSVIDLSENKRAEEVRLKNLRFLEELDRINRAIQGTNDLEQMMGAVLDEVLSIFQCDRAYLLHPCDPEAASWRVPMERTRPEYPGVFALGQEMPMEEEIVAHLRLLLAAEGPVQLGPATGTPFRSGLATQFGVQGFMAMALHPKVGGPWLFGIHQCSRARRWSPEEERLFREIGQRLTDGLTIFLTLRDLRASEGKLTEAQAMGHFGYWDRDLVAGRISLSDEACRIFGLPPRGQDLTLDEWHEQWLTLIHPEDRPATARAVAAALEGGPPYNVEYRVLRPGDEVRFVHSFAEVTRDASGQPIRMFGTMQDISEKKRVEEALRRLNDELEERVRERTAELEAKNLELARMNQLFVGRELRMIELKGRIAELQSQAGQGGKIDAARQ